MSKRRRRKLENKIPENMFCDRNIEHEIFAKMHALLTLNFFHSHCNYKNTNSYEVWMRSVRRKKQIEKFKFLFDVYELCEMLLNRFSLIEKSMDGAQEVRRTSHFARKAFSDRVQSVDSLRSLACLRDSQHTRLSC